MMTNSGNRTVERKLKKGNMNKYATWKVRDVAHIEGELRVYLMGDRLKYQHYRTKN
jgi:hypothetical protein